VCHACHAPLATPRVTERDIVTDVTLVTHSEFAWLAGRRSDQTARVNQPKPADLTRPDQHKQLLTRGYGRITKDPDMEAKAIVAQALNGLIHALRPIPADRRQRLRARALELLDQIVFDEFVDSPF
jgi:hypothetical protein